MSFEIEQKFRCRDHKDVAAKLQAMGASSGSLLEQEDTYLVHPSRDFAKSGEALRIRHEGDQNAVTYKGPRREGPTKTRLELEIPFSTGEKHLDNLRQLFDSLGFKPLLTVRKTRIPFTLDYEGRLLEVVLDDAEGVGTFVEVEAIASSEEDFAEAQKAVIAVSERLGLTELEPRSYLRMALERAAGRADT